MNSLKSKENDYKDCLLKIEQERKVMEQEVIAERNKMAMETNNLPKNISKVSSASSMKDRLQKKNNANKTNSYLENIKKEEEQIIKYKIEGNQLIISNKQQQAKISYDKAKCAYDLDITLTNIELASILDSLKLNQSLFDNCQKHAGKVYMANGEFLELEGCMPLLSLFQPVIATDRFLTTLESIANDLFLDVKYFVNLDRNFLQKQGTLAKQVLKFITTNSWKDEDYDYYGITAEHIESLKGLVTEIVSLHDFEEKKREVLTNNKKTSVKLLMPLSLAKIDIQVGEPETVKNSPSDDVIACKPWTVQKTSTVQKMKETIESGSIKISELMDELTQYLATHGPYLKKSDECDRLFRNFSPLGRKNTYHCHLGTSKIVAVWHVDRKTQTITIFYLGTHPNTYKSII